MVVDSTLPIAAERAMYFDTGVAGLATNGGHAVVGVADDRTSWSFAEGTTQPGFREFLTLLNKGNADASTSITYGIEGGGTRTVPVVVPARRRITVNVADQLGEVVGHSTVVNSSVPILAERPVYFNGTVGGLAVKGGHVAFGSRSAQEVFFAEGNVLPDYRQFVTLANPDPAATITVTLDYLLENGPSQSRTVTVDAGSRRTVQVFNAADPGGLGTAVSDPVTQGVSMKVHTDATKGVVVERPMYFSHSFPGLDGPVAEGHSSPGSTGLSPAWAFAEGTTLPGFDTFITIANPGEAQTATITYYTDRPTDGPQVRTVPVNTNSRTTVQMFGAVGQGGLGLERTGVSFTVAATKPLLVERPLYALGRVGDLDSVSAGTVVTGLALR